MKDNHNFSLLLVLDVNSDLFMIYLILFSKQLNPAIVITLFEESIIKIHRLFPKMLPDTLTKWQFQLKYNFSYMYKNVDESFVHIIRIDV